MRGVNCLSRARSVSLEGNSNEMVVSVVSALCRRLRKSICHTASVHGIIYYANRTEATHIIVHIPKTGGTALNQWIDYQHNMHRCNQIRTAHTHYLNAKTAVSMGYQPITIIRDPIERFQSSFYYWKHGSKDIKSWQRKATWTKANHINTPNDLIDILRDKKHPLHQKTIQDIFERDDFTHRHHFLAQNQWISGEQEKTIIICYDKKKLTKNIHEAFKQHKIVCPIDDMPMINQSNIPQTQELTQSSIAWIQTIYAQDMALWKKHCSKQQEKD